VHESTHPARKMLEDEGFRYQGYVDIFDAGPALETQVKDIRAVRDSQIHTVIIADPMPAGVTLYLVSNTSLDGYRCTMAYINIPESGPVGISTELAKALKITSGATLRAVPLFGPQP
jgi:arginine N-succinyltransferase